MNKASVIWVIGRYKNSQQYNIFITIDFQFIDVFNSLVFFVHIKPQHIVIQLITTGTSCFTFMVGHIALYTYSANLRIKIAFLFTLCTTSFLIQ